jgi:hypothetical protein
MLEPEKRVVTELPLRELWNASGNLHDARCIGNIGVSEITELLRQGPLWFVVADVGHRLEWVDLSECYLLWKNEVKPHLANVEQGVRLDQYPGEYAYFGKQWITQLPNPVVVLEKVH